MNHKNRRANNKNEEANEEPNHVLKLLLVVYDVVLQMLLKVSVFFREILDLQMFRV